MGKRVNLAALAAEDLYQPPASGQPTAIPTVNVDLDYSAVRSAAIQLVATNPLNKRPAGGDEDLLALAETMRTHGLIQPLVVCSAQLYLNSFPEQRTAIGDSPWVVLIGNRRLLAAQLAPLAEVPIIVNDDQIASMYEVMLIENTQRRDLPPVMEAEAMAEALKASAISQRELARRIGKSAMYVTQRLALLGLVPELRLLLEQGELTIEQGREFGELPEAEQRAIAVAGKPYRRPRINGVYTRPAARSIRVSTPAAAAESIRKAFSTEELAELIRLLSEQPRG